MKSGLPGARWIDQENLHLTIRFIGEVEDTYAEDIHYSLSTLRFETFPIRLKGIDTFRSVLNLPRNSKPYKKNRREPSKHRRGPRNT